MCVPCGGGTGGRGRPGGLGGIGFGGVGRGTAWPGGAGGFLFCAVPDEDAGGVRFLSVDCAESGKAPVSTTRPVAASALAHVRVLMASSIERRRQVAEFRCPRASDAPCVPATRPSKLRGAEHQSNCKTPAQQSERTLYCPRTVKTGHDAVAITRFRHASEKELRHASAPVCAHYDQIRA